MGSAQSTDRKGGISFVILPTGPFRMAWSILCLVLITWDVVMIPLQAFRRHEWVALYVVECSCAALWAMDIVLSLRTGYFDGSIVELGCRHIVKNYARTWMCVDLVTLGVTFGWILFSWGARARVGLQTLQCVRLLRLAKLQYYWNVIEDRITSELLLLLSTLLKMVNVLLIMVHVITCVWYALGNTENGWLSYYTLHEEVDPDNPHLFWYFAAMRWALAQICGRTDQNERRNVWEMFWTCVVALLGALIFMAVFISSITATLLEVQKIAEGPRERRRLVKEYINEQGFTELLELRVLKHLADTEAMRQSTQHEKEQQVMALLPKQLQEDIVFEQRSSTLVKHVLFSKLHCDFNRTFINLCNAVVQPVFFIKCQALFSKGDACMRMLFVERAEQLLYTYDLPNPSHEHQVGPLELLVEDPDQADRGYLVGRTNGSVLALEVEKFSEFLPTFTDVFALVIVYARWFLRELKKRDALMDDMCCSLGLLPT